MRSPLIPAITALLLLTGAARSDAQTFDSPRASRPAPVELGGNLTGLFAVGAAAAVAGPEVVINLSDRHALQLRADVNFRRYEHSWSLGGVYSALFRYTFADRPGVRSFVVAGLGGGIDAWHSKAHSYTTPAYTLKTGNTTRVIAESTRYEPAYSRFEVSRPVIGVLGIGSDFRLARRLSLHVQGDIGITQYGVGVRVSSGLSVPIGRVTR
jgi:hypothetical protein